MNTMEADKISQWRSPASEYPRRHIGSARIKTSWYSPGIYHAYMQHGKEYYEATKRLMITSLEINGKTWMVDDPPHWWAMQNHATFYSGTVLCAGLGLGLMVHSLNKNPDVKKIIVVERNLAVIGLVGNYVPQDKLQIHCADFYDWEPNERIDGVLFDLFVSDNGHKLVGEAIRTMIEMKIKYRDAKVFRIHGMENTMLNSITDLAITPDLKMTFK